MPTRCPCRWHLFPWFLRCLRERPCSTPIRSWLGLAAASIVATGAAVVAGNADASGIAASRRSKPNVNHSLAGQAGIGGGIPADVQELVRRAENPDYQQFPAFDRAWDRVSGLSRGPLLPPGTVRRRGAGKTATVQAITKSPGAGIGEDGVRRPALLCGSCPQPIGEPMAYAPFRQALAQHFEVNLLAPPGPKMQQISQALGGIFGSVIPFARISVSAFGRRRRCRRQAGRDQCLDCLDASPAGEDRADPALP